MTPIIIIIIIITIIILQTRTQRPREVAGLVRSPAATCPVTTRCPSERSSTNDYTGSSHRSQRRKLRHSGLEKSVQGHPAGMWDTVDHAKLLGLQPSVSEAQTGHWRDCQLSPPALSRLSTRPPPPPRWLLQRVRPVLLHVGPPEARAYHR